VVQGSDKHSEERALASEKASAKALEDRAYAK
jgi:hypothetical protein